MIEIIIMTAIMVTVLGYFIYFTPTGKSTRELKRLNKIWDEFNQRVEAGDKDTTVVERAIDDTNWKYHVKRVALLKSFIRLYKK